VSVKKKVYLAKLMWGVSFAVFSVRPHHDISLLSDDSLYLLVILHSYGNNFNWIKTFDISFTKVVIFQNVYERKYFFFLESENKSSYCKWSQCIR